MLRPDSTGCDIELRNRIIRSRTLEEELDRVHKKLQQFLEEQRDKPLPPGTARIPGELERDIKLLKTRIAEQKAK